MEIAPVSNNSCLQRGISIMRLALGYEKGLADDWEVREGGQKSKWTVMDEVKDVLNAFPKHHVRIICSDAQAKAWRLKRAEYHTGPGHGRRAKFDNNHILAISYMHNSYGECHFMICHPARDMMPLVRYVLSVSIKEKR